MLPGAVALTPPALGVPDLMLPGAVAPATPGLGVPDLTLPGATAAQPEQGAGETEGPLDAAVAPGWVHGLRLATRSQERANRRETGYRRTSQRSREVLALLLGAEALWLAGVIGYGVSWVAGVAGSARVPFQAEAGQVTVVGLNVGRFLGFVLPVAAMALLLGWAAVIAWRKRRVEAPTGRGAALVQAMAFVQPLVLLALTGGALLLVFGVGAPAVARPSWAIPLAIASWRALFCPAPLSLSGRRGVCGR